MIARAPDTKTRILDAAEKLFGEKGFDATSLRDITTEAEVNLAAVNYHFQSKESLIDAVISRRVEPVNKTRFEMLQAAGPNPKLEQILLAFLSPLLRPEVPEIGPLMGRVMATPDIFLVQFYKRHMTAMVEHFTAAFRKALPDLSETEVLWRLNFTAGAMAHLMARSFHLRELSDGKLDPSDRADVLARMVTFAAAGFRATEGF